MFKRSQAVTEYTWPVQIEVPHGGKYLTHQIDGRFRIPVDEDAESIRDELRSGQVDEIELARRIFIGWADGHVQDDDGSNMEPTVENIEFFLRLPYFRRGVIRAFIDSNAGKAAARKN